MRSTTRVRGPTKPLISCSLPTAAIRLPAMATAEATRSCGSTVITGPPPEHEVSDSGIALLPGQRDRHRPAARARDNRRPPPRSPTGGSPCDSRCIDTFCLQLKAVDDWASRRNADETMRRRAIGTAECSINKRRSSSRARPHQCRGSRLYPSWRCRSGTSCASRAAASVSLDRNADRRASVLDPRSQSIARGSDSHRRVASDPGPQTAAPGPLYRRDTAESPHAVTHERLR